MLRQTDAMDESHPLIFEVHGSVPFLGDRPPSPPPRMVVCSMRDFGDFEPRYHDEFCAFRVLRLNEYTAVTRRPKNESGELFRCKVGVSQWVQGIWLSPPVFPPKNVSYEGSRDPAWGQHTRAGLSARQRRQTPPIFQIVRPGEMEGFDARRNDQ